MLSKPLCARPSEADLLLHVVDFSDPEWRERVEVTEKVLADLGADQIPCIQVLNKIDRLKEPQEQGEDREPQVRGDRSRASKRRVRISARTGAGLDQLRSLLQDTFADERLSGRLSLPPSQGWLRARLYGLKAVRAEEVRDDGGSVLTLDIGRRQWALLRAQLNLKESESMEIDSLEQRQEGRGQATPSDAGPVPEESPDQGPIAVVSRVG